MGEYVLVGVLMIVGVVFPLGAIVTSKAFQWMKLRPNRPDAIKTFPYECGFDPIGPAWIQFNFRYYAFALMFLIFDVEIIFLLPWAVHFRQLPLFAAFSMFVFLGLLVVGLAYEWKKRALEWA